MVSLTLRFIPTFLDEAEVLLKAQASRGMDFQEGTLVQKIKGIASIVVPLLIQMFKKADTVALALETGYRLYAFPIFFLWLVMVFLEGRKEVDADEMHCCI